MLPRQTFAHYMAQGQMSRDIANTQRQGPKLKPEKNPIQLPMTQDRRLARL